MPDLRFEGGGGKPPRAFDAPTQLVAMTLPLPKLRAEDVGAKAMLTMEVKLFNGRQLTHLHTMNMH